MMESIHENIVNELITLCQRSKMKEVSKDYIVNDIK